MIHHSHGQCNKINEAFLHTRFLKAVKKIGSMKQAFLFYVKKSQITILQIQLSGVFTESDFFKQRRNNH